MWMQIFSGEHDTFAGEHKCFTCECRVPRGGTVLMWEHAEVLRVNAWALNFSCHLIFFWSPWPLRGSVVIVGHCQWGQMCYLALETCCIMAGQELLLVTWNTEVHLWELDRQEVMRCEKEAGSARQGLCVYSGLASNIPFYQQSKFPRWPLGPVLNVCCLLELMDLRRSAAGGGKTAYASVRRTEGEVDGKVQ